MILGKGVPGHPNSFGNTESISLEKVCPRSSLKKSRDVYHYQNVPSPSSNLVATIFQTSLLKVRFQVNYFG